MNSPNIYAEAAAELERLGARLDDLLYQNAIARHLVASSRQLGKTRLIGKARELGMPYGHRVQQITGPQLDLVLLPAITAGELSTRYNAGNAATEYRRAGRLLAVSVGSHHFIEVWS